MYNRYAETARVKWTLNFAKGDPAHSAEWMVGSSCSRVHQRPGLTLPFSLLETPDAKERWPYSAEHQDRL